METVPTPVSKLTVEQLFKLTQQHLMLWSKPDGLDKVYPQAINLAQRIAQAYRAHPSKWISQLPQHKPQYDYITNITVKAAIFTSICVTELNWSAQSQCSVIAATLTANIAALNVLTRQANQHPLNDKQKNILARSHILSYKLLVKHKVHDTLWLHTLSAAIPSQQNRAYPIGLQGAITSVACRFGKMLANPVNINKITVPQVLRQIYLSQSNPSIESVCQLVSHKLNRLGDGTPVRLHNDQLAIILQLAPDAIVLEASTPDNPTDDEQLKFQRQDGYLAFVCTSEQLSTQGRLTIIAPKHIRSIENCQNCSDPKVYSQLWESPYERFITDKGLEQSKITFTPDDIYTPPAMLTGLLSGLAEQSDLNKISQQISDSPQLSQLLTLTASQAANQDIQITDVKHAIAMLGLNRIGPLLTLGALNEILATHHFSGDHLFNQRLDCFIAAIKHYSQFNDLLQVEALIMYISFWLAPWRTAPKLQQQACKLYKPQTLQAKDAFDISAILDVKLDEQQIKNTVTLAQQWQLPKLCQELFRQLNNPKSQEKLAKRVATTLAVIKIATAQTHAIIHQLDLTQSIVRQQLNPQLALLQLSQEQFEQQQQLFLQHYAPFTPLTVEI